MFDRILDTAKPPLIVAELSGNHNQNLDTARNIVKLAADAGVDAIKLQTYTADSITLNSDREEFIVKGGLWHGRKLHDLYEQACTPYEWHAPLAAFARELGIQLFSTPFDEAAVDFLEESIAPPLYKISSFELTHIPLLEKVAQTGRPIILSTGMATETEIDEAVSTLRNNGASKVILLKCISAYPSTPEGFNLRSMSTIGHRFNCPIGLSDHTLSNEVAIAAVALGARVIEKHVTDNRQSGGIDAGFSLEPKELAELVVATRNAHAALGSEAIGASDQDVKQVQFRRSIYAFRDIRQGETFTTKNVKIVRPSLGLAPKYWSELLSCRSTRTIKTGEPIRDEDLKK